MSVALAKIVQEVSEEFDRVRKDVAVAEVADLGTIDPVRRKLFAAVRGMAYVRTGAALERGVSLLLGQVLTEIDLQGLLHSSLRLSLFSILKRSEFDAIGGGKSDASWKRRTSLLESTSSAAAVKFDLSQFRLNARTLRAEHFESIWLVFGLPGRPLPLPIHSLALSDLADTRNAIAHGHDWPHDVGAKRPAAMVLDVVKRTEEVIEHLWDACSQYVTNRLFIR